MSATLEPLDVEGHLNLLHAWVTHPKAVHWMMQHATREEVRAEYTAIAAAGHHRAWLGRVDGEPAFLAETYDPVHSPLADHLALRAGDVGMHVLVAPTERPVAGFTGRVMAAVLRHCFEAEGAERVLVEPAVENAPIHRLNARAGFRVLCEVDLPDKRARLGACTRDDFAAAELGGAS